jgi:hypothetical protein
MTTSGQASPARRVRAQAVRWVSDDFPGWLEASLVDAGGQVHRILEKAPVLSDRLLDADSNYPCELWIDAELIGSQGDRTTVRLRHGIETVAGENILTLSAGDVE